MKLQVVFGGMRVSTSDAHLEFGRRVNFESSNVNVGLPIFTIHGNHDDPAGANSLSAVDLLSTTSLVNYFGKIVRRTSLMCFDQFPLEFVQVRGNYAA